MSLAKRLLIAYLIGLGPFTLAAIYVFFGAASGDANQGAVFRLVILLNNSCLSVRRGCLSLHFRKTRSELSGRPSVLVSAGRRKCELKGGNQGSGPRCRSVRRCVGNQDAKTENIE